MQVILLEKVGKLGNLGDVVKVKDGFARNYLIPSKMARRATEAAIKEFETKRADLEKAAQAKLDAAKSLGEQLSGKTVRIVQKAGVDRRLFGSVTNADVAEGLTKMGLAVQKSQVRMPTGPLKTVGGMSSPSRRTAAVHAEVTVQVVARTEWSARAAARAAPRSAPKEGRLAGLSLGAVVVRRAIAARRWHARGRQRFPASTPRIHRLAHSRSR
ncbi:MAG: 50S ribosomal protein L9 [Rubrivivax sp.]